MHCHIYCSHSLGPKSLIWRSAVICVVRDIELIICDGQDQELLPTALQYLPPTKRREPDAQLRLTHVETLLLLCTTRWGRDYLRNHGVYEVVRALHENETVDKVSLVVLLAIDLLA